MNTKAERLMQSEFVVSYPNWGDRGRMRGSMRSPVGTLHRSNCPCLSMNRGGEAHPVDRPANVYETTLDDFRKQADRSGVANNYRVCRRCCAGIAVTGRNMERKS